MSLVVQELCSECGAVATIRCERCKTAYCDNECREHAWRQGDHKLYCRSLAGEELTADEISALIDAVLLGGDDEQKHIAPVGADKNATGAGRTRGSSRQRAAAQREWIRQNGAQVKSTIATLAKFGKAMKGQFAKLPSSPKGSPTKNALFKRVVRSVLRTGFHAAFQVTKLGTDATLNAVTFDAPVDTITDVLFTGLDATMFASQVLGRVVAALKSFENISLKGFSQSFRDGGLDGLTQYIDQAFQGMAGDVAQRVVDAVTKLYGRTVEWAAPLIGSAVELVVPSDFGASRVVVENFVHAAGALVREKAWDALVMLWNLLGKINGAQDLLTNPENVERMLTSVLAQITKLFPAKGAGWKKRLLAAAKRIGIGAVGTLLVSPFMLLLAPIGVPAATAANVALNVGLSVPKVSAFINRFIERHIAPRLPKIAEIVQTSVSLMFAFVYILSKYQRPAEVVLDAAEVLPAQVDTPEQQSSSVFAAADAGAAAGAAAAAAAEQFTESELVGDDIEQLINALDDNDYVPHDETLGINASLAQFMPTRAMRGLRTYIRIVGELLRRRRIPATLENWIGQFTGAASEMARFAAWLNPGIRPMERPPPGAQSVALQSLLQQMAAGFVPPEIAAKTLIGVARQIMRASVVSSARMLYWRVKDLEVGTLRIRDRLTQARASMLASQAPAAAGVAALIGSSITFVPMVDDSDSDDDSGSSTAAATSTSSSDAQASLLAVLQDAATLIRDFKHTVGTHELRTHQFDALLQDLRYRIEKAAKAADAADAAAAAVTNSSPTQAAVGAEIGAKKASAMLDELYKVIDDEKERVVAPATRAVALRRIIATLDALSDRLINMTRPQSRIVQVTESLPIFKSLPSDVLELLRQTAAAPPRFSINTVRPYDEKKRIAVRQPSDASGAAAVSLNDVATDSRGRVLVASADARRIFIYDAALAYVADFEARHPDDKDAPQAVGDMAVATDLLDNIYVAMPERLYVFDSNGAPKMWAGFLQAESAAERAGTVSADDPSVCIAVDYRFCAYVGYQGTVRIYDCHRNGAYVATLSPSRGNIRSSSENKGAASVASNVEGDGDEGDDPYAYDITTPLDLDVTSENDIVVADASSNSLVRFNSDGDVLAVRRLTPANEQVQGIAIDAHDRVVLTLSESSRGETLQVLDQDGVHFRNYKPTNIRLASPTVLMTSLAIGVDGNIYALSNTGAELILLTASE